MARQLEAKESASERHWELTQVCPTILPRKREACVCKEREIKERGGEKMEKQQKNTYKENIF